MVAGAGFEHAAAKFHPGACVRSVSQNGEVQVCGPRKEINESDDMARMSSCGSPLPKCPKNDGYHQYLPRRSEEAAACPHLRTLRAPADKRQRGYAPRASVAENRGRSHVAIKARRLNADRSNRDASRRESPDGLEFDRSRRGTKAARSSQYPLRSRDVHKRKEKCPRSSSTRLQ